MMHRILIWSRFKSRAISFLLAFIFFAIVFDAKAQDEPVFTIRFLLEIKGGTLENALVTITRNGAPFRVIDPKKGRVSVELNFGEEYLFTCTKMGFITKSVVVDTHVPLDGEKFDYGKFSATVTLDKQPEDQEITYTQPVGRIMYFPSLDNFGYDKDYTAKAEEMQKKAEATPTAKPKPPVPNPKPVTEKKTPPQLPPSNPIPVVVKEPDNKIEKPKPKPVIKDTGGGQKPITKRKEERVTNEYRKKITVITVTINSVDYIYKKEEYIWGGTYFYKDGGYITGSTFEKETE